MYVIVNDVNKCVSFKMIFEFCLSLCKNSNSWFQLLTRFVSQLYNTVGITWCLCSVKESL